MFGIAFTWIDGPTPDGGEVMLRDDHGRITGYLSRPAFEEDPDGFMRTLERHFDTNIKGKALPHSRIAS